MNRPNYPRRLVAILGLMAAFLPGAAGAQERFEVRTVTVPDFKAVQATVEALDQTAARTRIGGTLVELSVDEGSAVTAGQVIANVEDPKLKIREQAINQRITALESRRKLAETELSRTRQLRASGTVSQQRLDQAITELDVINGELTSMRAEKAVVGELRREGIVKAPVDGRVLAMEVTLGKVVLPGEIVARIASATYILRLSVPERHARFLAEGDGVLVGARGMTAASNDTRPGTIRQVYPELRHGRVVADVDVDGLGDYFVGERVRVRIPTDRRETFVVPESFLRQRYNLTFARLDGGAEIVVQTGAAQPGGIEVLSGLKPGDVLVKPAGAE